MISKRSVLGVACAALMSMAVVMPAMAQSDSANVTVYGNLKSVLAVDINSGGTIIFGSLDPFADGGYNNGHATLTQSQSSDGSTINTWTADTQAQGVFKSNLSVGFTVSMCALYPEGMVDGHGGYFDVVYTDASGAAPAQQLAACGSEASIPFAATHGETDFTLTYQLVAGQGHAPFDFSGGVTTTYTVSAIG